MDGPMTFEAGEAAPTTQAADPSAPCSTAIAVEARLVGRLDECIQWLVRRFYIHRFSEASLQDLGAAEVFVLAALGRVPRARMTDLARAAGIPLSTLTGVVDRLVQRKHARRAHGVKDRRQVLVALTARGRRAQQAYLEARMEMCAGMLGALGDQEGGRLVASLQRIREALGE